MVSVKVEGLRELEKKLVALGPKIGRKALKSALVAGGNVIKKEAQNKAPMKTGRLRKAMYIKRMSKPNPFKELVIFGVRRGKKMQKKALDAFYWTFPEFGTKAHNIGLKNKKVLAGKGQVFGREVSHPGVKAKSFVRTAFESKKGSAFEKIKQVLIVKIAKLSKEPA